MSKRYKIGSCNNYDGLEITGGVESMGAGKTKLTTSYNPNDHSEKAKLNIRKQRKLRDLERKHLVNSRVSSENLRG